MEEGTSTRAMFISEAERLVHSNKSVRPDSGRSMSLGWQTEANLA